VGEDKEERIIKSQWYCREIKNRLKLVGEWLVDKAGKKKVESEKRESGAWWWCEILDLSISVCMSN